jgi:hypothetical protein
MVSNGDDQLTFLIVGVCGGFPLLYCMLLCYSFLSFFH